MVAPGYNHVVNWNTFSKHHHFSCNFPYLYKLFCLSSFGKEATALLVIYQNCLPQGAFFLSFFLGGLFTKWKKKVLFQCIRVLCIFEGEIMMPMFLQSSLFSSVLKGTFTSIYSCKCKGIWNHSLWLFRLLISPGFLQHSQRQFLAPKEKEKLRCTSPQLNLIKWGLFLIKVWILRECSVVNVFENIWEEPGEEYQR